MPAQLTIRFVDRPARRFTLAETAGYDAGRGDGCALRVDDDRVSRRHAHFAYLDGAWRVTDLGSKNGLRVDGEPVAGATELPDRCWLSLGGVLARFEHLSDADLRDRAERDRERRETGLELQRGFDPARGLARLLAQVLDSVLRLAAAERGFVLLAGRDGALEVAAAAGEEPVAGGSRPFAGSAGAVERALAERRPVVTCDAREDLVLASRPSIADDGIRALVCLPLEVPEGILGAVYADSRAPGSTFTELDVEILEALTAQAALAVAVARLSREAEHLAGDLPTR